MKQLFHKLALFVFLISLLQGCAGAIQHQTASGRPEATIQASTKDVKTALVGVLVNMGYTLTKDTDLQVVAERRVDNALATLLMSSRYDPTIEARLTATVMGMGSDTRVTMDLGIVRNGGSAFEAVTPMTNSAESAKVQAMLDDIRTEFAAKKSVSDVVAVVTQQAQSRRAGT